GLPFSSASALPSRRSATAFSAESWLCAASTSGIPPLSISCWAATASMRRRGPTRIGEISSSRAASTAPRSELSSHGCATAVGVDGRLRQKSTRRRYLSCFLSTASIIASSAPGRGRARGAAPFSACLAGTRDATTPAGRHLEHLGEPPQHRTLLGRRLHAGEPLVGENALD